MKRIAITALLLISQLVFAYEPAQPPGYAVASAHPLATQAGLAILANEGNAFDAAVAVSAVLGVVSPYHSGLGGGGFWLLHLGKNKKNIFIDGRETAPLHATRDMYIGADGKVVKGLSINGGLAAAVPGQPAAIAYIASHYGRLPLETSLAPAIELAEKGFVMDHQFLSFVLMSDRMKQMKRFPATAKAFLKDNGKPYLPGELLVQKDLANTLKKIARDGHDGFYKGEVAKRLVSSVRKAGGIWTLEDLKQYQIKVRIPLEAEYLGMHIVTAPLPSGGGISLITMLNILSQYSLSAMRQIEYVHYVVESMRMAYWQRVKYLGDSDFIQVPIDKLISKANAQWLAKFIKADKATASKDLPKRAISSPERPHTTHFSIIDKEDNRVSSTQTVNFIFGSSVVAEGTGVLLNDEMDDFSSQVGKLNIFGVPGSIANEIAPGKRPLSSMTPTFLETKDRVAIVGTPGGSRIPTMVLLASLVFHEGKGAISMVSAMRFHHQYLPDRLLFEPETLSALTQEGLRNMGYKLTGLKRYYGDMQAISWDKKNQVITAASDPRHIGQATSIHFNTQGGYGFTH